MDNFAQAMAATAHFHHYDSAREASLSASAVPFAIYNTLLSTADSRLDVRFQAIKLRKKALGYDFISNQDLYVPLVENTDRTDALSTSKIAGVDMASPTAYDALFNRYGNLTEQMEQLLK